MVDVNYCSYCFNRLDEHAYLLGSCFCNYCYDQFEFVVDYKGKKCSNCEKKINDSESKHSLCEDCQYWQNHIKLPLLKNRALLYYNQFAHEVMERAKFMGDAEIWKGIAQLLNQSSILPKNNVQIIPSSQETYLQRDYDHLKAITKMLNVKTVDYVRKKEGVVSQVVLKTVTERKKLKNAFEILIPNNSKTKFLTIFDDVYTTGSTLKDLQKTFFKSGTTILNTTTIFRADLQF